MNTLQQYIISSEIGLSILALLCVIYYLGYKRPDIAVYIGIVISLCGTAIFLTQKFIFG